MGGLQQVAYLDNKRPALSSQVQYVYRSPVTRRGPGLGDQLRLVESARLVINNHTFYWLHHEDFSAIINEAGTLSVHQDTPTSSRSWRLCNCAESQCDVRATTCTKPAASSTRCTRPTCSTCSSSASLRGTGSNPLVALWRVQVWYCWQPTGAAGDLHPRPDAFGRHASRPSDPEVQANGDSVIMAPVTGSAVTATCGRAWSASPASS